jgi:tRNA pseudouridine38-40 synthase
LARTLKITLSYDGTDFAGWQRQANAARTVQAVLEDALAPIEKGPVTVMAAGRTDAGVHAAAQVASVSVQSPISCHSLRRALNATLPTDVRVLSLEEMPEGFSARRDARLKTYHYAIWNGVSVPPFLRRYAWHVPQPLDARAMNEAAAMFVGEHDFAAFQATGSDVKTTVRRVVTSTVGAVDMSELVRTPADERFLRYEVAGNGFLRHMVRTIVGTLADVGRQRTPIDRVKTILDSRLRNEAGPTAPPHGLVLWQVEY